MLLTDRLVVGVRSGLIACRVALHVVGGITFPSGFALVRVFIVVSVFIYC